MQGRPCFQRGAGANQLVLVMARLTSGSVLPDRPPKGLPRLEARRYIVLCAVCATAPTLLPYQHTPRQVLSFANVFGFRWLRPMLSPPSGGG
jgi:hypothetical protein